MLWYLLTHILVILLSSISYAYPAFIHRLSQDNIPEQNMTVSEMIRYHGYPVEEHKVLTEDGYILSLQRIPHGRMSNKNGYPVFLQHGFLDTAATWTMNLPNQSLAFILADSGYDVWLGNSRGNVYSSKHINLTVDDKEFWDFSFDEMARYDLPASINYVLNVTNSQQIHYVGHSQGTTVGFIAFNEAHNLASKIRTFIALAPVATVSHVKGAARYLAYMEPELKYMMNHLGINSFFPSNELFNYLAQKVCGSSRQFEKTCGNIVFLIAGFDSTNLNDTRIPIYLSHLPAGTSMKDLIHLLQMIKSGKFQMYDYGKDGNMKKYNQPTPPQYNVSSVHVPVVLYSGGQDWLADPIDFNTSIKPVLPNIMFQKSFPTWNHLDFVWGVEANEYIYYDVVKLMNNS